MSRQLQAKSDAVDSRWTRSHSHVNAPIYWHTGVRGQALEFLAVVCILALAGSPVCQAGMTGVPLGGCLTGLEGGALLCSQPAHLCLHNTHSSAPAVCLHVPPILAWN